MRGIKSLGRGTVTPSSCDPRGLPAVVTDYLWRLPRLLKIISHFLERRKDKSGELSQGSRRKYEPESHRRQLAPGITCYRSSDGGLTVVCDGSVDGFITTRWPDSGGGQGSYC